MPFGFSEPTIHDVAGFVAVCSPIETADGQRSLDLIFLDRSGKELMLQAYFRTGKAVVMRAYADAINAVALDHGVVDAERLELITGEPADPIKAIVYLDDHRDTFEPVGKVVLRVIDGIPHKAAAE